MDALEFIRERNRMCRTFDKSCDGGRPSYEAISIATMHGKDRDTTEDDDG